eukprot:TRINITY_DN29105_c0_g1_i1.p1 TRINITY_DN29105_c0_g1~~TRINITY_DN29105_c0_g1_i1.p1  ORF type:complete len:708 (-),score=116.62 TRINITY_DN29105_c0_g1_i1:28-2151(-)
MSANVDGGHGNHERAPIRSSETSGGLAPAGKGVAAKGKASKAAPMKGPYGGVPRIENQGGKGLGDAGKGAKAGKGKGPPRAKSKSVKGRSSLRGGRGSSPPTNQASTFTVTVTPCAERQLAMEQKAKMSWYGPDKQHAGQFWQEHFLLILAVLLCLMFPAEDPNLRVLVRRIQHNDLFIVLIVGGATVLFFASVYIGRGVDVMYCSTSKACCFTKGAKLHWPLAGLFCCVVGAYAVVFAAIFVPCSLFAALDVAIVLLEAVVGLVIAVLALLLWLCGACTPAAAPTFREILEAQKDLKFEATVLGGQRFLRRRLRQSLIGLFTLPCRFLSMSRVRSYAQALLVTVLTEGFLSIAALCWAMWRMVLHFVCHILDPKEWLRAFTDTFHQRRRVAGLDYPAWRPRMPYMGTFYYQVYLPRVGILLPGLEVVDVSMSRVDRLAAFPDLPYLADLDQLPGFQQFNAPGHTSIEPSAFPGVNFALPDVCLGTKRDAAFPPIDVPSLEKDIDETFCRAICRFMEDLFWEILSSLLMLGHASVLAETAWRRKDRALIRQNSFKAELETSRLAANAEEGVAAEGSVAADAKADTTRRPSKLVTSPMDILTQKSTAKIYSEDDTGLAQKSTAEIYLEEAQNSTAETMATSTVSPEPKDGAAADDTVLCITTDGGSASGLQAVEEPKTASVTDWSCRARPFRPENQSCWGLECCSSQK